MTRREIQSWASLVILAGLLVLLFAPIIIGAAYAVLGGCRRCNFIPGVPSLFMRSPLGKSPS